MFKDIEKKEKVSSTKLKTHKTSRMQPVPIFREGRLVEKEAYEEQESPEKERKLAFVHKEVIQ